VKIEIAKQVLETPITNLELIKALTHFIRLSFTKSEAINTLAKHIDKEFILKLLELLEINNEDIKLNVTWSLTNIAVSNCIVKETYIPLKVHAKILELLQSDSNKIKEQCLWALANIAGDCSEVRDQVIQIGIIEQLTKILSKRVINVNVLENTTWLISNLCKDMSPLFLPKVSFITKE
jgi:hypothetical protein